MEKDINMIIKNVVNMMQEELTDEQMHKLENVLYISFHGVKLQEECTSLVTSQSHWDKILKLFIASKRLENCSQGTIDRYVDCVTKLVNYLNKRFEDITTNDIRYYFAMYQETRKVSISYMDTLRRYFSSFFGWLSDEGFNKQKSNETHQAHESATAHQKAVYLRREGASTLQCKEPERCGNYGIFVLHSSTYRRGNSSEPQ